VTRDTRTLSDDGVFVAVRGASVDGHDLVPLATRASAVVVERPVEAPAGVTVVQVADTRRALAPLAAAAEGWPGRALRVVGVTGTNGKTTITTLVEEALQHLGRRAGRVGTTGVVLNGLSQPATLTTPEAPALQATLATAVRQGVDVVAIEASSIGLVQYRLDAIPMHTAVFTNLSRDHLDFHGDMAAYARAKARLFSDLLRPAGGWPRAVLCADDDTYLQMHAPADRWLYGVGVGDVCVTGAEGVGAAGVAGTTLSLQTPLGRCVMESPLVGRHNVSNLAGALAILLTLDVSLTDAALALSAVRGVAGRFEAVANPGGALLLVDYAHSPDALEHALSAARALCARRLFVVFGCGGDRDRGKRAQMGEVASRLADQVVVTSDNPRSEAPEAIIADVVAGCGVPPALVEVDRAVAISWAARSCAKGDVVLVAGKGHETYQEVGGVRAPFDDRAVLRAARDALEADDAL